MARSWLWLQLALAWLPMWALFTALIMLAHDEPAFAAAVGSLRMVVPGALLGIGVYRFTSRVPWPHPFRMRFAGVHVVAAVLYSAIWFLLVSAIDSLVVGHFTTRVGPGIGAFLVMGVWLYAMVAGVAYANQAAQRTAQLEAYTARMQLAGLRAQLHPHFLFNALHAIVHLISIAPREASRATEQLAGMLRVALEEERDLIPLERELALVEPYLAIEHVRFGDRLRVEWRIADDTRAALVPSFALQTLVENAVRHGAAHKVDTTTLRIAAVAADSTLTLSVGDDGVGVELSTLEHGPGTGLRRLRERLRWLYGERAGLDISAAPGRGVTVKLRLPLSSDAEAGIRSP